MDKVKKYKLEVKLMNKDELLVIENGGKIYGEEYIKLQFDDKEEFIHFGSIGVRRSEIEWYGIIEVIEGEE